MNRSVPVPGFTCPAHRGGIERHRAAWRRYPGAGPVNPGVPKTERLTVVMSTPVSNVVVSTGVRSRAATRARVSLTMAALRESRYGRMSCPGAGGQRLKQQPAARTMPHQELHVATQARCPCRPVSPRYSRGRSPQYIRFPDRHLPPVPPGMRSTHLCNCHMYGTMTAHAVGCGTPTG